MLVQRFQSAHLNWTKINLPIKGMRTAGQAIIEWYALKLMSGKMFVEGVSMVSLSTRNS